MPDITMCTGDGCPMKDKCWRHTARPSGYYDDDGAFVEHQAYFVTPPVKLPVVDSETQKGRHDACEYYWP